MSQNTPIDGQFLLLLLLLSKLLQSCFNFCPSSIDFDYLGQLSLASVCDRWFEYQPAWLELRQGAFTCVKWQVKHYVILYGRWRSIALRHFPMNSYKLFLAVLADKKFVLCSRHCCAECHISQLRVLLILVLLQQQQLLLVLLLQLL